MSIIQVPGGKVSIKFIPNSENSGESFPAATKKNSKNQNRKIMITVPIKFNEYFWLIFGLLVCLIWFLLRYDII